MDLNAGEGIQYVTTGENGEQQILIHGEGGQSLLQGAQIIDGKLVLPQPYQYVTENGETVMVVYETPDGQQVVSENGEQIVFLDESQAAAQGFEGGEQGGEPQTTYIQQVGEDGQTFLQQVTTNMAQEPQQTFIQISADESAAQQQQQTTAAFVDEAGNQFLHQAAGDQASSSAAADNQATFIEHQGVPNVKPGQSLLLSSALQGRQGQSQPQIHVAEGGPGSSTVVMVTSDQHEQPGDGGMSFIQTDANSVTNQQEMGQGDAATIEQAQAHFVEGMEYQQGIQEAIQPDGSRIQIKILKADDEMLEESPQPIAVMNMPAGAATSTSGSLIYQTEQLPQQPEPPREPSPEPVPFDIDEEPDEEGRIQMIDPETAEVIRFLPQPLDDIPVLITPEEFENEPSEESEQSDDDDFAFGRRFDADIHHRKTSYTPRQPKKQQATPVAAPTPKLLSSSSVVVSDGDMIKPGIMKVEPQEDDDDDEDDSDFDEENLTPKVVYERLLAQHRKTKECQVCGDMLESYPLLKEHLMEHAGYNPCECQICGKILSTSSMRAKHERSHNPNKLETETLKATPKPKPENIKKFECDVCGRQMGRIEHLKRHQLLHKPGPTWRCIICEYSFKREDLCKDHVKKQHKDALEQEELTDLYERLEYEGEENHQHKSQWNPKAKNQRLGMTPKGPGSSSKKMAKDGSNSTPKTTKPGPKKGQAGKQQQEVVSPSGVQLDEEKPITEVVPSAPDFEDEDDDFAHFKNQPTKTYATISPKKIAPQKSPVLKTPVEKKPVQKSPVQKTPMQKSATKVKKENKQYLPVAFPNPQSIRKSGRTPKPKKLDDYVASEEAISKAEKEAEKLAMKSTMTSDEESGEDSPLTAPEPISGHFVKESPHANVPDKILTAEEIEREPELDFEEEYFPDPPSKPAKEVRRTVMKTVVAKYQGSIIFEGKGGARKRKAMDPEDLIEEVVILDVKTPKMGKGPTIWKQYRPKNSSSPSTPAPYSGEIATPKTSKLFQTPTTSKSNIKSVSGGIPKGHKKIGEVTGLVVGSASYEDEEFVYYDDDIEDEDYDLESELYEEYDELEAEEEMDEDESQERRGPKKKTAGTPIASPKIAKSKSATAVSEGSGKKQQTTPISRSSASATAVFVGTNEDL